MIENIFISFACVSVAVSIIALLLALLKPLTSRIFSPRWHYFVTACVVIMMLMPIRIDLPVTETVVTQQGNSEPINETKPAEITVISEGTTKHNQNLFDMLFKYTDILSTVWLTVVSVNLVWSVVRYMMFISGIKRNSETIECSELDMYTKRSVNVRIMSGISSPFTTGILKPMLVLPEKPFSDEQLSFILAHEAVHINRFDVLLRWIAVIMKCVHWFNPAAYFISTKMQNESEIACDYELTRFMNHDEEASYMNTILTLATASKCGSKAFSTALSAKGKILERRFLMIKDKIIVNKTTAIISVIIAGSLLCTGVLASGVLSGRYAKNENAANEEITNEFISATTDTAYETAAKAEPDAVKTEEAVFIWPCDSTEVTAPFTPEKNHYATDIKAERGSDVYASLDATVTDTGFDAKKGNYIELVAGDTTIELLHLEEANVEIGDIVTSGEVIGKVGSTGQATGPHLHYAVSIDGEYVDATELETVQLVIAE